MIRFRTRTILLVVLLVGLFVNFVIAPEIRRANDFSMLEAEGAVLYLPPLVMFGGMPPYRYDPIPEPYWFSVRQRIASSLGIQTLPWISEGSLEMPEDSSSMLVAIVDSHDDFKELAVRRGTLRDFGGGTEIPMLDLDQIKLPASSASADPNEANP